MCGKRARGCFCSFCILTELKKDHSSLSSILSFFAVAPTFKRFKSEKDKHPMAILATQAKESDNSYISLLYIDLVTVAIM